MVFNSPIKRYRVTDTLMYVKGKIRPVVTISGMGE
jgi:hypothetical protein